MKKSLLLSLIIILSFSITIYSNDATVSIGNKYASATFNLKNDILFGVGLGFTADKIPSYTSFDDAPYSWWIKEDTKNKGNEIELFVGKKFKLNNDLNFNLAAGVAMQEKVELYWSTASYWFFGKESLDYSYTFQGSIDYSISDKYKINIGYHNLHGLIGGLNFSF